MTRKKQQLWNRVVGVQILSQSLSKEAFFEHFILSVDILHSGISKWQEEIDIWEFFCNETSCENMDENETSREIRISILRIEIFFDLIHYYYNKKWNKTKIIITTPLLSYSKEHLHQLTYSIKIQKLIKNTHHSLSQGAIRDQIVDNLYKTKEMRSFLKINVYTHSMNDISERGGRQHVQISRNTNLICCTTTSSSKLNERNLKNTAIGENNVAKNRKRIKNRKIEKATISI